MGTQSPSLASMGNCYSTLFLSLIGAIIELSSWTAVQRWMHPQHQIILISTNAYAPVSTLLFYDNRYQFASLEPSAPMMPSPHAAMPLFPGFGMHPGTQLPLMPGYPFLPGYPFPFYGAPHAPPPAVPGELSFPPSVASITTQIIPLPRPISITEFCTYYKIPDSDRDKLVSLEIELGDRRCEQLGEDEWKGDGKFTKLAWDRFKEKHARFCTDIANGLWDVTEN